MNWLNFVSLDEDSETIPNDYLEERIRIWRDEELKNSDWTQLPDSPVNKIVWAEYRQALRDLPLQFNDVKSIVFPVKPEVGA